MSPRRCFDLLLAVLLAPFALTCIGGIYIFYRMSPRNAGPFFYRGARLGKDKKIFHIFKIRTLVLDAEQKVGKSILSADSDLTITFGKFLRSTRLDELPQILNVIKGDMTILGPRSVRPAAYEKECGTAPNYDDRFLVKPGLVGYSQVLTPHAAHRRIRSHIDNRFVRAERPLIAHLLFGLYTLLSLMSSVFLEAFTTIRERVSLLRFGLRRANLRRVRRRAPRGVELEVTQGPFYAKGRPGRVVDMNHAALAVVTSAPLEPDQRIAFALRYQSRHGGRRRACCTGVVNRRITQNGDGNGGREARYVISYEPVSWWNRYLIDCYVLEASIGLLRWRHPSPLAALFQLQPQVAQSFEGAPVEIYYSEERVFQP